MKNRLLCMGLLMLCAGLVGCGDDDDSGNADAGSDSGVPIGSGGTTAPGTGGVTAGTGGMTSGTGGMAATAKPIMCGTNMCQPPAGLGGLLGGLGGALGGALPMSVACCLPDNSCGSAASATATCEAPAVPDMRCPTVAGGMGMGAGCCTESGQCGIDGALLGRGCVENGMAKAMLGPLSTFIMVPDPQACDAVPAGDAGTEQDAGH